MKVGFILVHRLSLPGGDALTSSSLFQMIIQAQKGMSYI